MHIAHAGTSIGDVGDEFCAFSRFSKHLPDYFYTESFSIFRDLFSPVQTREEPPIEMDDIPNMPPPPPFTKAGQPAVPHFMPIGSSQRPPYEDNYLQPRSQYPDTYLNGE